MSADPKGGSRLQGSTPRPALDTRRPALVRGPSPGRWPARFRRLLPILAIGALAFAATVPTDANPHGITGFAQTGCTCHAPAPDPAVHALLQGLPANYTPGKTYRLEVAVEGGPPVDLAQGGHAGGFDLRADRGALRVPRGSQDVLKSEKGATWHDMTAGGHGEIPFDPATWGELTFTHAGANSRAWTVEWRAPREGSGPATFDLAVLAANGDHLNSTADRWNRTSILVAEGAPAPAGTFPAWAAWSVPVAAVAAAGAWIGWRRLGARRPAAGNVEEHPDGFVPCPTCGASVRRRHLAAHAARAHGH